MPSYKLEYFDVRGWAEVTRQLFHLSGTPYEDVRVNRERDWPEKKKDTPFGQMPILTIDGEPLPQSFAIARYIARKFGYAGKTDFEEAWVDALGDQFKDYAKEMRPYIAILKGFDKTGDKETSRTKIGDPTRDKFFAIIEKRLSESTSGFLVGGELTWIDLVVADHVDILVGFEPDFLAAFPMVLAHREKVQSIPKIKEWLGLRPKNLY